MAKHYHAASTAALIIALHCVAVVPAHAVANQSSTRFGSSAARDCFLAAESRTDVRVGLAVCEEALTQEALRPRDRAATLVNRGILKTLAADNDGALRDYNAAISLMPNLGDAYINRGLLYLQRGDNDALAAEEITKGLAFGSRDEGAAYYGRAFAYEGIGRVTEAYQDFKRAAELKPRWDAPRKELERFSVKKVEP